MSSEKLNVQGGLLVGLWKPLNILALLFFNKSTSDGVGDGIRERSLPAYALSAAVLSDINDMAEEMKRGERGKGDEAILTMGNVLYNFVSGREAIRMER